MDNIFCLFQGHIENLTSLKQQYGLGKTANEVIIVIEAYKTLRDRGPFPASHVVRDLNGKFAFILYDSSSNSTFVAAVSMPSFIYHCSVSINYSLISERIVALDSHKQRFQIYEVVWHAAPHLQTYLLMCAPLMALGS